MNNAAHVQTAASPNPKHRGVSLEGELGLRSRCMFYLFIYFFKYRCMLLIIREKVARLALVR